MKIKAPLHSMDARGRFGIGMVFSSWRGLSVGRAFTVPRNPRSSRQLEIRGLMTSSSRAWSNLTDENRTGWEVYAGNMSRKNIFGQDVKASGFNEYIACFLLASEVGETPVSIAPTDSAPLTVTAGAITQGTADGEIDVDWTAGQAGFVDVWITPALPAGRKPQESDYKHLSYTADATGTLTIDGLVGGVKYSVRIRQVALNGQVGPPLLETLLAKSV